MPAQASPATTASLLPCGDDQEGGKGRQVHDGEAQEQRESEQPASLPTQASPATAASLPPGGDDQEEGKGRQGRESEAQERDDEGEQPTSMPVQASPVITASLLSCRDDQEVGRGRQARNETQEQLEHYDGGKQPASMLIQASPVIAASLLPRRDDQEVEIGRQARAAQEQLGGEELREPDASKPDQASPTDKASLLSCRDNQEVGGGRQACSETQEQLDASLLPCRDDQEVERGRQAREAQEQLGGEELREPEANKPDRASPADKASLLPCGDDQEVGKGRQVRDEAQEQRVLLGDGQEQREGGAQEQRYANRKQPERNKQIRDKHKTYKLTKITDYIQEKQAKSSKEGRILADRRKEDPQVTEEQENQGGGGTSRAVKAREELLVPVAPPHHPPNHPPEEPAGKKEEKAAKGEEKELTLLQKMRARQQTIRGGDKGKSPKTNNVRKPRKEVKPDKREEKEELPKMRKMLERWRKEAEVEKPQEAAGKDLQDCDQVKLEMNMQEGRSDVRNMIEKYSIKHKEEMNSYESWKELRKEGKKRKAPEEHFPSNKKQDTGHTRVLNFKSETSRKQENTNLNFYLAQSDDGEGGGQVQGGGAEVLDKKPIVQSALAAQNGWQTRFGGACLKRKQSGQLIGSKTGSEGKFFK